MYHASVSPPSDHMEMFTHPGSLGADPKGLHLKVGENGNTEHIQHLFNFMARHQFTSYGFALSLKSTEMGALVFIREERLHHITRHLQQVHFNQKTQRQKNKEQESVISSKIKEICEGS